MNLVGSHTTRRPLVDFLNRMLAANDLFGVMTTKLRPRDLILGRRTETIEEQLAKYWTWGWTGYYRRAGGRSPRVQMHARWSSDGAAADGFGAVEPGRTRVVSRQPAGSEEGGGAPDQGVDTAGRQHTAANATARNPGIPQVGVGPARPNHDGAGWGARPIRRCQLVRGRTLPAALDRLPAAAPRLDPGGQPEQRHVLPGESRRPGDAGHFRRVAGRRCRRLPPSLRPRSGCGTESTA